MSSADVDALASQVQAAKESSSDQCMGSVLIDGVKAQTWLYCDWQDAAGRCCRLAKRSATLQYCPTHDPAKERIPCPLDPKHTVYAHNLKKHLRKCNAGRLDKEQKAMPYYQLDANAWNDQVGQCLATDGAIGSSVWSVTPRDSPEVVKFFKSISSLDLESLAPVDESHVLVAKEKLSKNEKHNHQLNSMLQVIDGTFAESEEGTCGVELGAGKAKLSLAVHQRHPFWKHLLVDIRRSFCGRGEKQIDDWQSHCFRATADLKDFRMGAAMQHAGFLGSCPRVAVLSKHLCGSAFDVGLRSLTNMLSSELSADETSKISVVSVVMASCCHHRCTWDSYLNPAFMKSVGVDSVRKFQWMTAATSWAPNLAEASDAAACARKEIGRRCKLLIDEGRRRFLVDELSRHSGTPSGTAFLAKYVPADVTPENRLLVWCTKGK